MICCIVIVKKKENIVCILDQDVTVVGRCFFGRRLMVFPIIISVYIVNNHASCNGGAGSVSHAYKSTQKISL